MTRLSYWSLYGTDLLPSLGVLKVSRIGERGCPTFQALCGRECE